MLFPLFVLTNSYFPLNKFSEQNASQWRTDEWVTPSNITEQSEHRRCLKLEPK